MRRKTIVPNGRGYAWLCDFGLCEWVEPTKDMLLGRRPHKPSPEAKPVAVRIIREKDYQSLMAR